MNKSSSQFPVKKEFIASKILLLRNESVLLDVHLAQFYDIETRVLKQAVRRNMDRFPDDFMFELSDDEINEVVSQNVIPSKSFFGGAAPFAFTENGVAMLSSVLKSKAAIEVNIAIMRTFTTLRKAFSFQKDIILDIDQIKNQLQNQNDKILLIFKYIRQIEEEKQQQIKQANRKRIGYKS